jgi:hypothetical protein
MSQFALLNYFGRREDANGHREIEGCPFLLDIGWSEIDSDPSGGKVIATVLDRCFDPVLGFLHCTFREPNGSKGRKALGNVYLYLYHIGIDSKNRTAQDLC